MDYGGRYYTHDEHDLYAQHMAAENDGLRRHIDNKTDAIEKRLKSVEDAQLTASGMPTLVDALTTGQQVLQADLSEIKELVVALNAVGITGRLDSIHSTLSAHGETLKLHGAQLDRHENEIKQLGSQALQNLKVELKTDIETVRDTCSRNTERVTELEKADGKKALKWLGIVATAVIGVLVGGVMSALGIFS